MRASLKQMARVLAAVVALCQHAVVGAEESASSAAGSEYTWAVRLPMTEKVEFRGVVSFDGAGTQATQMMYPAPNAGTFVAAVIAHGLLAEGAKQKQKKELQAEADKVLEPYQRILATYGVNELATNALAKTTSPGLVGDSDKLPGAWLVETAPVFAMTQDQQALILDNTVAVHRPGVMGAPVFSGVVRVVSDAKNESDLLAAWTSDDGQNLREVTASLLAESLDIALAEALHRSTSNSPQRTFRYPEGSSEKMERASLVREQCHRLVIRTLRGWPMSIPRKRAGSDVGCPNSAALGEPQP